MTSAAKQLMKKLILATALACCVRGGAARNLMEEMQPVQNTGNSSVDSSYAGVQAMVVDAGMLTTDIIVWGSILIAVLAMALAGAGRSNGLLNLLLAVQTAAFTIQMRVQLPVRVQELLQHFKWATFDIRLPWHDSIQANVAWHLVARQLLWIVMALAAVTVAQQLVATVFRLRRKVERLVPDLLHAPRLQMLLALVATPAVAEGAAGLFSGEPQDIILGILLIFVLPGVVLVACLAVVARLVIREGQAVYACKQCKDPGPKGCAARLTVLPRLCAFWLAGSAVGHGTWVPLETDRAFVARLGVAFEGTRGMPTQPSIDPRGKPPLPRKRSRSHICHCLDGDRENAAHPGQAFAQLAAVFKTLICAILIFGIPQKAATIQIAALLAVHTCYLLCLRGCQPWGSRLEQGALVVNEAGEVAMWALGAVLLVKQRQAGPGSMQDHWVGSAMLAVKAVQLVVMCGSAVLLATSSLSLAWRSGLSLVECTASSQLKCHRARPMTPLGPSPQKPYPLGTTGRASDQYSDAQHFIAAGAAKGSLHAPHPRRAPDDSLENIVSDAYYGNDDSLAAALRSAGFSVERPGSGQLSAHAGHQPGRPPSPDRAGSLPGPSAQSQMEYNPFTTVPLSRASSGLA